MLLAWICSRSFSLHQLLVLHRTALMLIFRPSLKLEIRQDVTDLVMAAYFWPSCYRTIRWQIFESEWHSSRLGRVPFCFAVALPAGPGSPTRAQCWCLETARGLRQSTAAGCRRPSSAAASRSGSCTKWTTAAAQGRHWACRRSSWQQPS